MKQASCEICCETARTKHRALCGRCFTAIGNAINEARAEAQEAAGPGGIRQPGEGENEMAARLVRIFGSQRVPPELAMATLFKALRTLWIQVAPENEFARFLQGAEARVKEEQEKLAATVKS